MMFLSLLLSRVWAVLAVLRVLLSPTGLGDSFPKLLWGSLGGALVCGWSAIKVEGIQPPSQASVAPSLAPAPPQQASPASEKVELDKKPETAFIFSSTGLVNVRGFRAHG